MEENAQQENINQPESEEKRQATATNTKTTDPNKDLFVWKAPARPFKKRDRQFWITILSIVVLMGSILFVAEGVMPVLLIISIAFFYYVLSTIEPEVIEYKIDEKGITFAGEFTSFDNLPRFWFSRRFGHDLIIFQVYNFAGRLELVINPSDKGSIRKVLKNKTIEEEVPPSRIDRAANWFSNKLPGNQPQ